MANNFKLSDIWSRWQYAKGSLIGFRGADDSAEPVSPSNPLPVTVVSGGTGGGGTAPTPLRVLGSQELTLTAAAQALTVPAGATYAEVQVQGGDARVRYDGTAPTATTGILWTDGESWSVDTAAELSALRLITASGTPKVFAVYKGA